MVSLRYNFGEEELFGGLVSLRSNGFLISCTFCQTLCFCSSNFNFVPGSGKTKFQKSLNSTTKQY